MTERQTLELNLTRLEVVASVGAVHQAILERLEWVSDQNHWYREEPLETAQQVFNALVSSYQQLLLATQGFVDQLDEDWTPTFTFSADQWTLIDAITLASEWKDVPTT